MSVHPCAPSIIYVVWVMGACRATSWALDELRGSSRWRWRMGEWPPACASAFRVMLGSPCWLAALCNKSRESVIFDVCIRPGRLRFAPSTMDLCRSCMIEHFYVRPSVLFLSMHRPSGTLRYVAWLAPSYVVVEGCGGHTCSYSAPGATCCSLLVVGGHERGPSQGGGGGARVGPQLLPAGLDASGNR